MLQDQMGVGRLFCINLSSERNLPEIKQQTVVIVENSQLTHQTDISFK